MLQNIAECCSVLQQLASSHDPLNDLWLSWLPCCSVLQLLASSHDPLDDVWFSRALCCSVLQRVAACCSRWLRVTTLSMTYSFRDFCGYGWVKALVGGGGMVYGSHQQINIRGLTTNQHVTKRDQFSKMMLVILILWCNTDVVQWYGLNNTPTV